MESSEEDFTAPWEREKPLETGTELIPFHVGKSGDKSKRKMKRKKASLEASSGSTMRGLQSQLATRAVAASERTKGPRKSKRSSAEKVGEAIVKAPNIGKVKKEKKEKKSKKERKRKKKRSRPGGDPSSSGESESSEENSEDSSSEKSQGSSEDYENPMRRKSIKRPGSVLELLVQHARDQLEQSSTVGIPQGKMRIDEGVRILSYFQILLRPQLGPVTGPVREMFLIASVLDQLRSGNLSAVGDGLAARFFALHQSILDGGWNAARHLEIFCPGGHLSHDDGYASADSSPCKTYCQSDGIGDKLVARRRPWTWWKGWQGLKRRRWRCERTQRKRQGERKRPRRLAERSTELGWRRQREGGSGLGQHKGEWQGLLGDAPRAEQLAGGRAATEDETLVGGISMWDDRPTLQLWPSYG